MLCNIYLYNLAIRFVDFLYKHDLSNKKKLTKNNLLRSARNNIHVLEEPYN